MEYSCFLLYFSLEVYHFVIVNMTLSDYVISLSYMGFQKPFALVYYQDRIYISIHYQGVDDVEAVLKLLFHSAWSLIIFLMLISSTLRTEAYVESVSCADSPDVDVFLVNCSLCT